MTRYLDVDQSSAPIPRQPTVGTFVAAIENAPPIAATRHLSAGAYVDEEFCRSSIVEVYHQPKRLVAPSYGFDLTTVLGHCLKSRKASMIRDIVIVSAIFVSLITVVGIPALIIMVIALAVLQYFVSVYRLVRDVVAQIRSGERRRLRPGAGLRLAVRATGVFLISGVVIAFLVFTIVTIAAAAAKNSLDGGGGGGNDGSVSVGTSTGMGIAEILGIILGILLFAAVFGATIGTEYWRQLQLETLAPDRDLTPQPSTLRMNEIRTQEAGNVVVYSGTFPFVGSGEPVTKWGSALRLIKPAVNPVKPEPESTREFADPPFTAIELSDYVATRLRRVADAPDAEHRIPRLIVEDQVFLAGTEVGSLSPQLPQRDIEDIIRNPSAPARHYLACRVVSWRGQLVTSVYATFALQGQTLYLEMSTWALPPCRDGFRVVDDEKNTGTAARLRAVVRGLANTPRIVGNAPINLVRILLDKIAHSANVASGSFRRGYDYGARVSVREMGSAPLFEHSLHNHDVTKYSRIIERRILADVTDFMEMHGVDTSELRARAFNILNNGALNLGTGNFSMGDGNAVGPSAQAGAPTSPTP